MDYFAEPQVTAQSARRSLSNSRRTMLTVGVIGFSAASFLLSAPALAQSTQRGPDTRPQCRGDEDNERRPYCNPLVAAEPTNPDPGPRSTPATQAPQTANVAGIQVTTTPTTIAPATTVATVAAVVSAAPQPQVLGVSIEEQAEDVAFTGSESGKFTSAGVMLTAIGATLIAITRRRRRTA